MSKFRTLGRIYGILSPPLQRRIALDIENMIAEMFDAATELWSRTGFKRFNDHEANCTIQLYRWSDEIVRDRAALRALSLQLEWIQPTPQMLAGEASAEGSSRPDLRISVGRAASRIVECKRLSLGSSHPQRYVSQGIARFVSGEYASDHRHGTMVGYIQADDPASIVSAINAVIVAHPTMGDPHQLHEASPLPTIRLVYDSDHQRQQLTDIRLKHYLIDLRIELGVIDS